MLTHAAAAIALKGFNESVKAKHQQCRVRKQQKKRNSVFDEGLCVNGCGKLVMNSKYTVQNESWDNIR